MDGRWTVETDLHFLQLLDHGCLPTDEDPVRVHPHDDVPFAEKIYDVSDEPARSREQKLTGLPSSESSLHADAMQAVERGKNLFFRHPPHRARAAVCPVIAVLAREIALMGEFEPDRERRGSSEHTCARNPGRAGTPSFGLLTFRFARANDRRAATAVNA